MGTYSRACDVEGYERDYGDYKVMRILCFVFDNYQVVEREW